MSYKNTRESYNGWANYDTWNFKLWLDNEQSTQEMINDFVKTVYNKNLKNYESILEIKTFLEQYALENAPELSNGFYSDVLGASIRSVDYYSIAESYFNEYVENHNNILEIKTA